MTNFIELAERSGFSKDLAISVYRAINGGYYLDIYYSGPPCLAVLDSWPRKYFTRRTKTLVATKPDSIDVVYFYAYLDLYSLYTMSSLILGREGFSEMLKSDMKELRKLVKDNLGDEPRIEDELELPKEAESLGEGLRDKRLTLSEASLDSVLNELAYTSKVFEDLKRSIPWARAVSKGSALKSLFLAGLLSEFVSEADVKLKYLASGLYRDFDRILLSNGLLKTLKIIHNLNDSSLRDNYHKVIERITQIATYI